MIRFTTVLIFGSFAVGLGLGAIAVAATSGLEEAPRAHIVTL